MSAKLVYLSSLLLMYVLTACSASKEDVGAKQTIANFYTLYLSPDRRTLEVPLELKYSKTLQEEMTHNRQICADYATSVCGWDGEGDPYLLAVGADEDLNYENSQIKIVEISPAMIQVSLNPKPSLKTQDDFSISFITYKMLQEEGVWVVDDIFYGKDLMSVRESIKEENAAYIANPDEGSIADLRRATTQ